VVRFDATTLWHFDAAEWAPSTASEADLTGHLGYVRFTPECVAKLDCSWRSGSAVNFGGALVQLSRVRP